MVPTLPVFCGEGTEQPLKKKERGLQQLGAEKMPLLRPGVSVAAVAGPSIRNIKRIIQAGCRRWAGLLSRTG